MRLKTTFAALMLAALPTMGFAMCDWQKNETTAASCAEGTVYDPASGTCVTAATS